MIDKVEPNSYDLRKLQLVEAAMLKDVKKACMDNGITFYLDSGTLLGAVRHNGFIPWDNDIDIVMPYEDYKRFLEIGQSALGDRYFVQSCYNEAAYYRAYARVRLNNSTMMYPYEKRHCIHHGIWLDVFPLANTKNGFAWKFKKKLVRAINVLRMDEYFECRKELFEKEKGKLTCLLLKCLYKTPFTIRRKLHDRILDRIIGETGKGYMSEVTTAIKYISRKEVFEGEPAWMEFEDEEYPVPSGYDEYLTDMYGDYMTPPPENERGTHENLIVDFDNDYTKYMEV